MTIEELQKLSSIQREIEIIKKQISNLKTEDFYVTDKVKGSSANFPYTQRSFVINGYDHDAYYGKLTRLKSKLESKINELIDEQEKVMDFIYSIPDSVMRQIVMCKYVDGRTWEQIGNQTGYSGRNVKRIHRKFIEKYCVKEI